MTVAGIGLWYACEVACGPVFCFSTYVCGSRWSRACGFPQPSSVPSSKQDENQHIHVESYACIFVHMYVKAVKIEWNLDFSIHLP